MDKKNQIPDGYTAYFVKDSTSKFYTDTNYTDYKDKEALAAKSIIFDLDNYTSNVTDMQLMFWGCSNLTSLDLSNFDTSIVTGMYNMFYDCYNLTSLDVSNFNTSNVTDMSNMFYDCSNLSSLDLSNFDTSNVTSMYGMFYNCSKLQYLILNNTNIKFKYNSKMALPNTTKILVPASALDAYKADSTWSSKAGQFDAVENYTITRSNGQITVKPK